MRTLVWAGRSEGSSFRNFHVFELRPRVVRRNRWARRGNLIVAPRLASAKEFLSPGGIPEQMAATRTAVRWVYGARDTSGLRLARQVCAATRVLRQAQDGFKPPVKR